MTPSAIVRVTGVGVACAVISNWAFMIQSKWLATVSNTYKCWAQNSELFKSRLFQSLTSLLRTRTVISESPQVPGTARPGTVAKMRIMIMMEAREDTRGRSEEATQALSFPGRAFQSVSSGPISRVTFRVSAAVRPRPASATGSACQRTKASTAFGSNHIMAADQAVF